MIEFPPAPIGMRGRADELATLVRTIERTAPTKIALVGSGGSGKSMLACALGHRLAKRFGNRIHWFRIGAWDASTLSEMLALRFGTSRERRTRVRSLRKHLALGPPRLIVLDNHEDDRATARLLSELDGTPVTFVLTARRCLLAGVLIFPVTAPLVTSGRSAFPRVASLTRALRWNPLALDIADALVRSRATTAASLGAFLEREHVTAIHPIAHEDDLPEVALLVEWAWSRLGAESRRVLAVLAHVDGDHVDERSLLTLARTQSTSAITALARWHLVQEPLRGRFALHAVVRHAVAKRTQFSARRLFDHYVALLEKHPERVLEEQSHLFAAMDFAHREGDLAAMLRVERLLGVTEA